MRCVTSSVRKELPARFGRVLEKRRPTVLMLATAGPFLFPEKERTGEN